MQKGSFVSKTILLDLYVFKHPIHDTWVYLELGRALYAFLVDITVALVVNYDEVVYSNVVTDYIKLQ